MSVNRYYIRGKTDKQQFKMVNGEIKRTHEARGEDTFDSIHAAIFYFARAMRNFPALPQGITFEHHMLEEAKTPCPHS